MVLFFPLLVHMHFFLLCFISLKRERTWSGVHREVKEDLGGVGAGRSMLKIDSMNFLKNIKNILTISIFTYLLKQVLKIKKMSSV